MKNKLTARNKKDPIRKIMKVNNKVFDCNAAMNEKLIQILERSDFDRPILMHDKLDQIWEKKDDDDKIVEQQIVKNQLKNRKKERVLANQK